MSVKLTHNVVCYFFCYFWIINILQCLHEILKDLLTFSHLADAFILQKQSKLTKDQ